MEYQSYKRIRGSIIKTMDEILEKHKERIFFRNIPPVFIIDFSKRDQLFSECNYALTRIEKSPFEPFRYKGIPIYCENLEKKGFDSETVVIMDENYYKEGIRSVPRINISLDEKERLPKRYIVNKGAVILFWEDGTKTIVKRNRNDKHDPIKGFLWAYFEKSSGMTKTQVKRYLTEVNNGKEQERKK